MKTISVIEMLESLVELGAFYVPTKNYNRIGDTIIDKTNNFKYKGVEHTPILNMVISEDSLNASILYKVNGSVEIGENDLGLPNEISTFMYRTHTIIREGQLNMNSIRFTLPDVEDSNIGLIKRLVLDYANLVEKDIYEVDLTQFPVYKDMIDYSAVETIYNIEKDLIRLKIIDKYLKPVLSKEAISEYTEEQQEFLSTFGIQKDGSYRPLETEVVEKSSVPTFEFKTYIKGASTVPSIKVLKEGISKKAHLNLTETVAKDIFEKLPEAEIANEVSKYYQNKKELFNTKTVLLRAKLELLNSNYKSVLDSLDDGSYKKEFEDGTLILKIKK